MRAKKVPIRPTKRTAKKRPAKKRPAKKRQTKKKAGAIDKRHDKEMVERLEKALVSGNSYTNAAEYAGIGERTFFRWKAEALEVEAKLDESYRNGMEKPESKLSPKEKLARQFWQKIKKAESTAAHRNVTLVNKMAQETWQAAAWWLERRFPEDWALTTRHELSGRKGGAPIKTEHQDLPRVIFHVPRSNMDEEK